MKNYFLPLIVIASFLGTSASAQVFRGGGSSGTACPSGSQYKGNGFSKGYKIETIEDLDFFEKEEFPN